MKASELIEKLEDHIKKFGDSNAVTGSGTIVDVTHTNSMYAPREVVIVVDPESISE